MGLLAETHTTAAQIVLREVRFPPSAPLSHALGCQIPPGWEVCFRSPSQVFYAWQLDQLLPILCHVESCVVRGAYAAGFIAYEASPAFDPNLAVSSLSPKRPYAVWGIFSEPELVPVCDESHGQLDSTWKPKFSREEYVRLVNVIHSYLNAGDTYQVNFTFPLEGTFQGDPLAIYRRLCQSQPSDTAAFVDLGAVVIASASPELFFELDGNTLRTRPMKGTMPRGLWPAADIVQCQLLRNSPKQRAENLMIVDLLRNDMGRISEIGSITVEKLFAIERYPTVWQMTSTVASRTDASIVEILRALFPCGSVTGAPKIRTMQIIRDLEAWPRWVYCGAIGWMAPNRRCRFSVPIRTVVLEPLTRRAFYNVGSGIVTDSQPETEYEECLAKARILTTSPLPEFDLLETLRYEQGSFAFFPQHLARLGASAEYFGFPWNERAVVDALDEFSKRHRDGASPLRVRLVYSRHGRVRIESAPLEPFPTPLRVAVGSPEVRPDDVTLYHKTTCRDRYERVRKAHPGADDVILCNCYGYLTESTIANLVLDCDGKLLTPPVECGLLPGVFRQSLLEEGKIQEAALKPSDLVRARKVFLINSVRGWMEAQVIYFGAEAG